LNAASKQNGGGAKGQVSAGAWQMFENFRWRNFACFAIALLIVCYLMLLRRLGIRALTVGFVLEILGFGAVLLAVNQVLPKVSSPASWPLVSVSAS
jgi:hypothetical protein